MLMRSINAAAAGGAHHVSGSQRSLLPRTSLFVLVFPCAAAYLPSLLNCLANISARERQISLFPVDIVLSELAVAALIIQHLFLFLAAPLSQEHFLPHLIFSFQTLLPLSSLSFFLSFFFCSPFPLFYPLTSFSNPPLVGLYLQLGLSTHLPLMLRTSQLQGSATGALQKKK